MKDIILYVCAVGSIIIDLIVFTTFIKGFPCIIEEKINDLKIKKRSEIEK